MPLKAGFTTFEKVSTIHHDIIDAKERSVAHLACVILEEAHPSQQKSRLAQLAGKVAGKKEITFIPHDSAPKAFYESDDGSSETQAILCRSNASSLACLFTREVLQRDETTGEPTLGPLQPRAAITLTNETDTRPPVLALDEAGYEVWPTTMTLNEREAFIDDIAETLTIIRCNN